MRPASTIGLPSTISWRGGGWFFLLGLAAATCPATTASAQPVITSPTPNRLEVTVYRDPDRGTEAMNIQFLNGFALISERRRVRLPAGESVVRFEGVAGGIVPQSAIVTGFPDGIVERNRDAYLLSPATLIDRSLGRRVHIRRTSLATGAVREQEAVVLSGAAGAVVLQTADGIEALRCTGQPQGIVHDEVPPGLSAKPTLSVRTRTNAPVEAEVTLSYLATGFDWQSNYVLELSEDGRSMDLFAWLTLASQDETSFPNADTQAVAGNLNYTRAQVPPSEGGPLQLRCWPSATTSDIPLEEWERMRREENFEGAMAMAPPAPGEDLIVTGTRIPRASVQSNLPVTVVAQQEDLGALKLYRIPIPVTVAANAQKQVALLVRENVPVETVYRGRIGGEGSDLLQSRRMLVTRNREQERLGVPLPSGAVAAFVQHDGAPFLVGQGQLDDRAVGEDVEIEIGTSPGVSYRQEVVARDNDAGWRDIELTVTSDQPRPIKFEGELQLPANTRLARATLSERDGFRLWTVTVPANGTRILRYRLERLTPR